MAVQTAAGAKLYIGPANSSADSKSAYEALSFQEVGEIENFSDFGDSYNEVRFTAMNNRRVQKFKGSVDAGSLQLTVGRDPSDAGQADLKTALAADDDYAFRVDLNDEGSGSPANPTIFYFRGKVMSYTANIGNSENVVRSSVGIAINSAIVEVDPV